MSGKASRNKGASSEREVAEILRQHGWKAERTPLSGGMKDWPGDLQTNIPGIHLEIKRQEKLALPAWIRQSEADCPDNHVPAVVFRQSRQPWRIVLPFDHWLDLLHPWVAMQYQQQVRPNGDIEYVLRKTIEGE